MTTVTDHGGVTVDSQIVLVGLVVFGLLIYLVYAMLYPERF
jgi:K+-transporting ATPase KdpF subunit